MNWGSTTDYKRNCNRKLYYSQVLGEVHGISWGATWRGQGRVQAERQDLGRMPLLGPVSRLLWGSWAEVRLVNLNQKNGVLVRSMGVLPKGYVWYIGAGRQGRLLITRDFGEVISGTYICLWPYGLLARACTYVRGYCQFKVPAGHAVKQNEGRSSDTIE